MVRISLPSITIGYSRPSVDLTFDRALWNESRSAGLEKSVSGSFLKSGGVIARRELQLLKIYDREDNPRTYATAVEDRVARLARWRLAKGRIHAPRVCIDTREIAVTDN